MNSRKTNLVSQLSQCNNLQHPLVDIINITKVLRQMLVKWLDERADAGVQL